MSVVIKLDAENKSKQTGRQKPKTPMAITASESLVSAKSRSPQPQREQLHDWSHAS